MRKSRVPKEPVIAATIVQQLGGVQCIGDSAYYGIDVLNLERIIGLVLADNAASIRVLEKVGMRSEGEVIRSRARVAPTSQNDRRRLRIPACR